MTHTDTGSAIVYSYTLAAGQTLAAVGSGNVVAQSDGLTFAHLTSGDTYSVTATSGGGTQTINGNF